MRMITVILALAVGAVAMPGNLNQNQKDALVNGPSIIFIFIGFLLSSSIGGGDPSTVAPAPSSAP
jgi:hypothetical protein